MMRIGLSDAFVCVPVFREYPCSVSGCGDVFAAAFCLQTDRQRLMMSSAFFAARQRHLYSTRMRVAADFIIYRKRYLQYEFEYMERKDLRFLTAQTISLFGSSLVQYAIVWYITLTTSSGKMLTISTL